MDEDITKFARIALLLPANQVSLERVFLSLKLVLNDLRIRLGDDVVDAILILHAKGKLE